MGLKQIRGNLRKKALFLRFLDFPGAGQDSRCDGLHEDQQYANCVCVCIVKGEAQKSPVFLVMIFWGFCHRFEFLRCACFLGIPVREP